MNAVSTRGVEENVFTVSVSQAQDEARHAHHRCGPAVALPGVVPGGV